MNSDDDSSNDLALYMVQHTLNSGLVGVWTSPYDGWTITSDGETATVTYDDGGYGYDFAGTIASVTNFTANSGVLIIQFTHVGAGYGGTVGKYEGIYFSDLSGTFVNMAQAAAPVTYAVPETDTLAEAETRFTLAGMTSYVTSWGSGYTKQQ
jgi:hypothetical protein